MTDEHPDSLPPDRVVLGCWPLGGAARNLGTAMGWSHLTPETAERVIATALSAGIRRFDTADAYGLGLSETRLGEALVGVPRDTVSIASKVGYLQPADGSSLWTPTNLRQALEGSLSRLRTDYLDTYFVHHNSLTESDTDILVHALDRFRHEGLIRQVGIRGPHRFSRERGQTSRTDKRSQYTSMLSTLRPNVVSLRANLLTPAEGIVEVYEWARGAGAAVQVYKPLAQGLLTTAFPTGFPSFGDGDHRSKKAWFRQEAHRAVDQLRTQVTDIVPGHSLIETAVAWVLHHCPQASLVIGSVDPAHVEQLATIHLPGLNPVEIEALAATAERYRAATPQYLD